MRENQPESLHFCEFHHDERDLNDGLMRYAETGLRQRRSVVVIASGARCDAVRRHLAAAAIGATTVDALLVTAESPTLLATFMRDGMPDRACFRESVGRIVADAAAKGEAPPYLYGEMVSDLWNAGNPAAAIALEELWNELLAEYPSSLFCGYLLDAFDPVSYSAELEHVCRTHTDIGHTRCEERVRNAIDEACRQVLGTHLSSMLSQSRSARDTWQARLPLSRRAVLWLKSNTPSRLPQVLQRAKDVYGRSVTAAPGGARERV